MTTPLKAVAAGGNSAELREWVAGDSLPVALGGTGGTTAAAARSNLGLGSAAVAAIVGTVSQSGGVPTGAIIQRGSNASGEFVRFADGTQICWKTQTVNTAISNSDGGSVLYSPAVDLGTYPAAFSGTAPSTTLSVSGGGAGAFLTSSSISQTLTSWGSYYLTSGASRTAANYYISCVAIGRWF